MSTDLHCGSAVIFLCLKVVVLSQLNYDNLLFTQCVKFLEFNVHICRCDVEMTPCEKRTCVNGECVELTAHPDAGDPVYSFCACMAGYTGEHCETYIGKSLVYNNFPFPKRLLNLFLFFFRLVRA